jgi:hypothetical protein
MGRVKVRCYTSSRDAAGLTVIGKIADDVVALVSPVGPAVRFSVSLNQTAGERDERIVAALRERLGTVDVPLTVPITWYEPQPNEATWFDVALHRGCLCGGCPVAEWSAEVYVVDRCAATRSVAPTGPDTRRLEAQVRALSDEGRRLTRENRAANATITELREQRRADERKLREALNTNEGMAETIAGLVQLNIEILAKSKTLAAEYRRISRDH